MIEREHDGTCPFCDRRFMERDAWRRHVEVEHEERSERARAVVRAWKRRRLEQ